ncbi:ATP-binding protein [Leptospira ilyithenensis]|uniref:ATP-binding protein n=1 Tax=Leptospira ilyithenensis TaxID=2484901 RepID=A0A4R9LRQ3_9LEPT|nr:ATP-binding protein [Leptospira ilyithenensis]TGN09144.1 ATP-binding protein [Leptospira ilyithenensis]
MKPENEKTYIFPNDLDSLSEVRREVRSFLGENCPDLTKGRIVFCLDEVITNVIEHGFPEPKESGIRLKMQNRSKEWKFIINDEGIYFDPTKLKSETWRELYESGADGGFGIRSVKKIMTVSYKRLKSPPENQLTLVYSKEANE